MSEWTASLESLGDLLVERYQIAASYAALGDRDQTVNWLERAFEERSLDLAFIAVQPEMDSYRADPQVRGLMQRMHLPA